MTRLQKKCFVAAAGSHLLLLGVVLATAAFRSEPDVTESAVLTMIPSRILDRAGSGGDAPAVVAPQPARAETTPPPADIPAPSPREIYPRRRDTRDATPQPPTREFMKPAPDSRPEMTSRQSDPDKSSSRSAPTKHTVVADLSTPVTIGGKKPSKNSDSSPSTSASSNSTKSRTATEIAREEKELASMVRSTVGKPTVVDLPGQGGGEAFIGYSDYVFNAYNDAWKTPDETTARMVPVEARIEVARDGTIISARIVKESGDAAVDHSVRRALDEVKQLPPFPAGANDLQRTFLIKFNLEAKESSG